MEETPTKANDVAVHELDLLRRADIDASADGDSALGELHGAIRTRRTRRSAAELDRFVAERSGARFSVGSPSPASGPGSAAGSGSAGAVQDGVPGEERTPAPTHGAPGRILAIESYGPTVRVFRIGRPAGFTFRPGQYLKLGVPGASREDFSVASAPHDPHLELAIELRPGGKVTPALFALGTGDGVDIGDAAKGKLLLDSHAEHHLMIATVTGIAPLRSMVRHALHTGTTAAFTILHGASYSTELPYRDELTALSAASDRVRYVPTVSRPDEAANRAWTGATGRVDPLARLAAGDLDPATTHVYAVGNAGMIKAVRRDLGGAGFPVSTESYGG